MKKLLVTGYPGWLTQRFLETLSDYSFEFESIRCLVLNGTDVSKLPKKLRVRSGEIPVEFFPGNILDKDSLSKACEDVHSVLHAAGILHVKKISDFYAINRDGVKNVLSSAAARSVKRVVVISSNAAQGFCDGPGQVLTEADPCRPEGHYGQSKYEGEKAVFEFMATGAVLETVVLRPAMFYGPPVAPRHLDIFRKVARGWFPVFGHGRYNRSVTYIDNLVQAIHLALVKPQAAGQTYTITDAQIPTLNDLVNAMASAMGRKVRLVHFPAFLAAVAWKIDAVISAAGRYWMLPHIVGESTRHIAYSIEKARRELGYAPQVTYQEGYRRTMAWCREQGYEF